MQFNQICRLQKSLFAGVNESGGDRGVVEHDLRTYARHIWCSITSFVLLNILLYDLNRNESDIG